MPSICPMFINVPYSSPSYIPLLVKFVISPWGFPHDIPIVGEIRDFFHGFSKATIQDGCCVQLLQEEHEVGLCDLTGSCGKGRNDDGKFIARE